MKLLETSEFGYFNAKLDIMQNRWYNFDFVAIHDKAQSTKPYFNIGNTLLILFCIYLKVGFGYCLNI